MKSALVAMLVIVVAVVLAVAVVPRSDLPPAVQVARDHVDAVLDEAGSTAQRVVRRAEHAFDDVRDRVGSTTVTASRSTVSGSARVVDGDTLDVDAVRVRLRDEGSSRASAGTSPV